MNRKTVLFRGSRSHCCKEKGSKIVLTGIEQPQVSGLLTGKAVGTTVSGLAGTD